jgi:predicted PurR-regulated permease PerM
MQLSSEQKRQIAWLFIASLLGYMAWLLMPVLTPFVVALVLAYALTPVVNWLDRLGKGRIPRVLVVVIVELCLLLVITGIFC